MHSITQTSGTQLQNQQQYENSQTTRFVEDHSSRVQTASQSMESAIVAGVSGVNEDQLQII